MVTTSDKVVQDPLPVGRGAGVDGGHAEAAVAGAGGDDAHQRVGGLRGGAGDQRAAAVPLHQHIMGSYPSRSDTSAVND